jgi:pimeloyl-ACP methyl ester carboxylesterase
MSNHLGRVTPRKKENALETTSVTQKERSALKILLWIAVFVLFFSVVAFFLVKNMHDKFFPRHDRPDYSGYIRFDDVTDKVDITKVKFSSGSNTLAGYIFGAKNNKGLVVIAHGLGGGAESYLSEAMYFVKQGWRVFSYDCTGSHASEGKNTRGLPQSVIDLNAALEYVASNDALKDLPIMLYGHSWGGYAVTAILNFDYQINAVASIAGYNAPVEIALEQARKSMGLFAYIAYPVEWAYQKMLFGSAADLTAVNGINRADTPVLIIHGSEDQTISYNGAAIIAHRNQITNPNVSYKTCSAENQNGHSNLFRSTAAITYINEKNAEYKQLYEQWKKRIPDDVRAEYYAKLDKQLTSELDADFMNEVNEFFEKSLE